MPSYGHLRLLARANNAGGASASIIAPAFDPENLLMVNIRIAGYSAASIARLQFNGDVGTTAYSYSVSENFAAPSTAVAAAAAGWNCATATGVARAMITFWIRNFPGQEHGGWWHGGSGSLVAATAPTIVTGAGVWATTNQITQITLDVGSGGGTLNAGTEIAIYAVLG